MEVFEILILAALGVLIFLFWRGHISNKNNNEEPTFLLLQQQLQQLTQSIDERLNKSSTTLEQSMHRQRESAQAQLDRINNQLLAVQKGLTQSTESSKQVLQITEALQNLERTLQNQKTRGSLGEQGLKLILENILGPQGELYQLQYSFQNNEAVDAIIRAKDGMICIDAKFSLDNYQRLVGTDDEEKRLQLEKNFKNDLKKRIDETAKYIRPSEGTLDFALMYIPAEGIYYDLLVNQTGTGVNTKSLVEYANQKRVIIVSPMTLYAYLQTVLHGFNAFKIERQTADIQKNVSKLKENLARFDEYHTKLGNSLGTVVNHYNASRKKFVHIDRNVLKITGESAKVEKLEIEKPSKD